MGGSKMKTCLEASQLHLADAVHWYMHLMADTGERYLIKFNYWGRIRKPCRIDLYRSIQNVVMENRERERKRERERERERETIDMLLIQLYLRQENQIRE
jgi:hypothetical protein